MSKITINQMSYYYVDYYNPVYENVSQVIDTDWKLGLIGRNGRGKTTLLKLLKGEIEPTAGKVITPVQMEYFPYENQCKYTKTQDIIKENIGGIKSMEDMMEAIVNEGNPERFETYTQIQERYLDMDGYAVESKILKEIDEMNLDRELLDRAFDTLSGGEKTRIMLLILFLRPNRFILLDEPTNHLDQEGKEAIAAYLKKKKGFIVVSHDRAFLDRVIDHVIAINKKDIAIEKGNYSSWKHNKDMKEAFEFRTREKLEREIVQLEVRSKANRHWAQQGEPQKYLFACNARANGAKAYMKQAKRSEERVQDNLSRKRKLLQNYEEAKCLSIHQTQENEDCLLLKVKDLNFRYTEWSKRIIKDLTLEVHSGERIWIKGPNGAGKSTLLRLLSQKETCERIDYAEGIQIAVVGQEPLWTTGYAQERFKEEVGGSLYEKFLGFCKCFELPDNFLERPLETYSSGELKKIDIARALSRDSQLILLDEPLNYMDTYFREQLEEAVLKDQPTLIFVEHDEWFGRAVATRIIKL